MVIEVGKGMPTSIRATAQDRERADVLIDAGLATTFSEAIRIGLAVAVRVVDKISATMAL